MAPRERTYTSADNLRLVFRDWGEETSPLTPALCLAGLTRNSSDFNKLARHLAPRRIICPDLRGRGRSAYAPDWRTYDWAIYLDDIRHLLAALGLGKVILVGTSMGGLLGMAMAAAMPTVLAGLVINDVGPELGTHGVGRILDYIAKDRPQPDWPSAVRHLKEILPHMSLVADDDWLDFARGTFREHPDGLLHFDWDINLARPLLKPPEPLPDLWAMWHATRAIPTLVIRGEVSDILSAKTLVRMQAARPDMRQATVPAVGHAPVLNEPIAVKAIDDFLRAADHR